MIGFDLEDTRDSFTDHLIYLEQVLERLEKSNLCIIIEKCAFAKQEFKYLGYLVTTTGIRPLPSSFKDLRAIALILGNGKLLP
jgi:hypothetical protein